VARHVADQQEQGAVLALDHVVEVTAQQRLVATRGVAGNDLHARVADQRLREQTALKAGILGGARLGGVQPSHRLVGSFSLDGIADGAVQHLAVDVALDQIVLSAEGD